MSIDTFRSRRLRCSGAIALAISTALAQAAQAQNASSGVSALEEVVVTAERRQVNLQDVPTSATVLSADTLETRGVGNILDVQQVAPSIAINTYNRSTYINIRGVGIAQSAPTSNPGVAYYIDGVFIPHEQFISQSFFDIDSIEVLRGPQGTLTGQNSTGGAVYVRTPAPDFEKFSGYIDQTVANYDWYRTVAAINAPLSDKLAIRVAATYDTRGSFTENLGSSPSDPGSGDLTGARIALKYQPTESLGFDLRYEYFDRKSDYNAIKNRNDRVTRDPFKIEEDAISFLNQDGYRASAEMRWDVTSGIQLRALTSYLDGKNKDQADGDRTATALPVPLPLPTNGANTAVFPGRVGLTTQSFETSVTEINLLSTYESSLQWVVGAFYLDETTPVSVLRDNRNTRTFVTSASSTIAEAVNTSKSVFGQIDYKLTDRWALDIGLRYSDDNQDYTRFALPGAPPAGCFPCTNTAASTETTGRAGIKFFATDDLMLYTTYSKGYKAGGVNLDPRLNVFGPETNEVAELGVKSTVADGRLRINGAVFSSDYQGIQLSALTPIGGAPTPNTLNAAPADIYGGEIELIGQFGAAAFNLGASYLHGEFTKDKVLTNGVTGTNQNVPEGTPLPFSPEYTLNAGVEYAFAFNDMSLTPRLQLSYAAEQYATPFPSAATRVPSHVTTDLRVTFKPTDNIRLEGFATNLLDKTYIAVQLQDASSATGGYIYGAPRQYGIRAKYEF